MKPTLHLPIINIDTFFGQEEFLKLKASFYRNDIQFSSMDEMEYAKHIKGLKGVIPIRISNLNKDGDEFHYIFENDYLLPALNDFRTAYLKRVKEEGQKIYGADARIDFLIKHSKIILKALSRMSKINYITTGQKVYIKVTLEGLLDIFEERIDQLKTKKAKKLQLNLSKGDALYLFKVLHELNLIKGSSIYDIMHFVEDNFNYAGNKEIKGANKALNTYLGRHSVTKFDKKTLLDFFKRIL